MEKFFNLLVEGGVDGRVQDFVLLILSGILEVVLFTLGFEDAFYYFMFAGFQRADFEHDFILKFEEFVLFGF